MKKLLVLTLILALVAGSTAFAQRPGRGMGDCDNPHFGKQGSHHKMGMRQRAGGIHGILAHGEEINLTDQQRDQLEKMMVDFQIQRVDKKAELEKAQIKLKALMRDEADQSAVNGAIDKVSALKADMQKMRYDHRQKAKAVLTKEQIDKLKQLGKSRKACSGPQPGCKGTGPGQGMGPGPGTDPGDLDG